MKQHKYIIATVLLLICTVFNACKSVQHIHFPVLVSKETCKGKCPIYSVELLKNGSLRFEGFENTRFIGKQTIKLSKEEFKALSNSYKNIDFSKLEKSYDQRLYDFPVTRVKDQENAVSFKRNQSVLKELTAFVKILDNILKEKNLI